MPARLSQRQANDCATAGEICGDGFVSCFDVTGFDSSLKGCGARTRPRRSLISNSRRLFLPAELAAVSAPLRALAEEHFAKGAASVARFRSCLVQVTAKLHWRSLSPLRCDCSSH